MNRITICNWLHLSSWMSIGNWSTASSLLIGLWRKSCSITHPFWSLQNKKFSQEEKFLNNISLRKKKIRILSFDLWVWYQDCVTPGKAATSRSVYLQPVSSKTEWSAMWWVMPKLHWLYSSLNGLIVTLLGSKGQNIKILAVFYDILHWGPRILGDSTPGSGKQKTT